MDHGDKNQFTRLMAVLGEVFSKEISPELAEIYYHTLEPYSIAEVTGSVGNAVRTLKFFPKPVELIEPIWLMRRMSRDQRKITANTQLVLDTATDREWKARYDTTYGRN